jgi:hypothetical protein
MYPSTTMTSPVSRMAVRARSRPYSSSPFLKSGVSGVLRYFGTPSPSTRPGEADQATEGVADREHQPLPEAVVAPPALVLE